MVHKEKFKKVVEWGMVQYQGAIGTAIIMLLFMILSLIGYVIGLINKDPLLIGISFLFFTNSMCDLIHELCARKVYWEKMK